MKNYLIKKNCEKDNTAPIDKTIKEIIYKVQGFPNHI